MLIHRFILLLLLSSLSPSMERTPRHTPTPTPTPTPPPLPPGYVPSHVSQYVTPSPDPDFPGWSPQLKNLSSCSYIIPMDYALQGCGKSNDPTIGLIKSACDTCSDCLGSSPMDFNLFAYGLVNHLLWNDIPVLWIIRTGKLHDDYDIQNVSVKLVYPQNTVDIFSIKSFAGGPFAVETIYTEFADPFIVNYTMSIGLVRVYMTQDVISVDVRYKLLSRPYVAVLASSGYQFILEATLISAGFMKGVHWDEMTKQEAVEKLGNGTCITLAMEPHFHACNDAITPSIPLSFVTAARSFLNYGSNFYAMCGGISTYEQCDNEDGTSCSSCSSTATLSNDGRFITANCNCSTLTTPCYGTEDRYVCGTNHPNVGVLPLNGTRTNTLCGSSNVGGAGYMRANPIVPGYCKDGFFVSENVNDTTYGGLYVPPFTFSYSNSTSAQINKPTNFHNMNPDIPFNQWEGSWEYISGSSVRYMTLFHSVAEKVKPWQQTKLRAENWAHFTVSEENYNRDISTNYSGYPYGIYYAAHAKLSKFHSKQGGNVFYVAGHSYVSRSSASTGYTMTNHSKDVSGCVDASVGPYPDATASLLTHVSSSNVALSTGGGCFNKQGRRMLLNAVLTPSNLTCYAQRSICTGTQCQTVSTKVTLDPCKAFGICQSTGVKRFVQQVSSTTPTPTTINNSTCRHTKCGCNLYLDCCNVCGGDGSSCIDFLNGNGGMQGSNVNSKVDVIIGNYVVNALVGDTSTNTVVVQPPISLTYTVPVPILLDALEEVQWPDLSYPVYVVSSSFVEDTGPITLVLSDNSVDPSYDHEIMQNFVFQTLTSIFPDLNVDTLVKISVSGKIVTISFPTNSNDSRTNVTTPTPVTPTQLINVSGNDIFFEKNAVLYPDSCQTYFWDVGLNVYSVILYVAIQSSPQPGMSLTVNVSHNDTVGGLSPPPVCSSPDIVDNNEYQMKWKASTTKKNYGSFYGHSQSLNESDLCKEQLLFTGVWYADVCVIGSSPVSYSFQVTLTPSNVQGFVPVPQDSLSSPSLLYGTQERWWGGSRLAAVAVVVMAVMMMGWQ